jgi:catechol 2,3-dioxygenase-like lactoylglutathione lyase family enzyme
MRPMSEKAPAVVGFCLVCIDCRDAPRLAQFWADLLGGSVEADADSDAVVRAPGPIRLDFLQVPEAKTIKNRLHIDVAASDVEAATQQALVLGATLADDVYDGRRWQVLRDPEGNEFCLLPPELS